MLPEESQAGTPAENNSKVEEINSSPYFGNAVLAVAGDKIPVISYFCPEINGNSLSGLSVEDDKLFRDIVLKQYSNGRKIKISYYDLTVSSL